MNLKFISGIAIFLVSLAIIVVSFELIRRTTGIAEVTKTTNRSRTVVSHVKDSNRICANATTSCIASTEMSIPSCNQSRAMDDISKVLQSPLSTESCKDTYSKLASYCPSGCNIDTSSVIVVPGKLQFQYLSGKNTDVCSAKGKRPVIVRAACRRV